MSTPVTSVTIESLTEACNERLGATHVVRLGSPILLTKQDSWRDNDNKLTMCHIFLPSFQLVGGKGHFRYCTPFYRDTGSTIYILRPTLESDV